ncbi:MAG: VWA-like domain-containing protein [Paracoccaceae bacterium]|nr:VWA-like domain-containing protein [Paracoccaceae bacterium]
MTSAHSKRASPALRALVEADPALAALSLWCDHRDGDATCTDGSTISYGPDFETLARHEPIGVAAHHILHVALRHSARLTHLQTRLGGGFDAALYNLAADALVNEALLLAEYALPRPAVTLTGLLAEALEQDLSPQEALATWDIDRLYFGLIGHAVFEIPQPRTPWELILRRTLTRAVTVAPRVAPHRPSRRWLAGTAQAARSGGPSPGFEPGSSPLSDVPRIAVALDASGSIDDARLALFWAEVLGITRRMRAELHLLVFDDGIRYRARIEPSQTQVSLPDLPRGGGTAFVPVVQEARDLGAAALVILTDLEGDPGPPPRGLRVIWAVPDAGALTAPFGQLIDLSH